MDRTGEHGLYDPVNDTGSSISSCKVQVANVLASVVVIQLHDSLWTCQNFSQ